MTDKLAESLMSAIEVERATRRLPVRLQREQPWGQAIGCALFLGLLLMAIAGVGCAVMRQIPPQEKDRWVAYVFIGVFGVIGVLLFMSGIHQWFASRVRETIVEIDQESTPLGGTIRICFRQEGPVTLNSLRANLRCVERQHKWGTRTNSDGNSESYKTTNERDLITQNVLDEDPGSIAAEEFWEKSIQFQIPRDARASFASDDLEIVWKLEVWGKVPRWPDFMHPYLLEVTEA